LVNVHLIRTIWAHWSAHSGVNQFVKYVDPARFAVREQLVVDGFRNNHYINEKARAVFRRSGVEWYKLYDFLAEARALPRLLTGRTDVLHYLDADHTAFLLPHAKRLGATRARMVASYHQPPDILRTIAPRHVVTCFDRIVVVSPEQAEYFSGIVDAARVRLIMHGIDTEYFRPSPGPRRPGPFRCLTVGFWLRDFQAISQVADRLSGRRDIEFHVVAPETGDLQARPNLTIHRGIPDDELRRQYQEADILFLPLLKATANNVLLEGLATGLPIVTTGLPSVKTYLDGAEAALVEENDAALLADTVLGLIDDTDRRARMSRSSRARAEQLDWRQIAKQYEDVYVD
jgi:glycosyltransferase involved in cell wall biosynthesis